MTTLDNEDVLIQSCIKKPCKFPNFLKIEHPSNSNRVTMSPPKEDSDAWVFDTIKQSTVAKSPTVKRRKLSVIHANGQMQNDSEMAFDLQQLSLKDGPLSPGSSPAPITVRKASTALRKKPSIFQLNSEDDPTSPKGEPEKRSDSVSPTRKPPSLRAPLKPDISFGNSPSTVRLFRRVSDKSQHSRSPSPQRDREREIPSHALPQPPSSPSSRRSPSPSHRSNQSNNSNISTSSTLQGSIQHHVHDEENQRPKTPKNTQSSANNTSNTKSNAGANAGGGMVASKEILFGRRLYSKAIDPSLQEIHAQTSNQAKRDALAKLADAFATLDAVDPEGELLFLKTLLEKVGNDKKLVKELGLGGKVGTGGASSFEEKSTLSLNRNRSRSPSKSLAGGLQHTPILEPMQEDAIVTPTSPSPKKALPLPGEGSPLKLVLAQNNPHLRSHRRRVASGLGLALGGDISVLGREGEKEREKEKLVGLPGREVPGMEHLKDLAEVLYSRWSDGLRGRWPNV